MDEKLEKVNIILKKYKQEHLLNFYDELSETQKNKLLDQILTLDFEKVLKLYNNKIEPISLDSISPINHIEKELLSQNEIESYTKLGEQVICQNSLAVVTMAGGQGTRLGYKGPKGTYEIEFEPPKSLFQIMCEDLQRTNDKYNIIIPWYIMTSDENDKKTKKYFEEHNFFGYPENQIKFFVQNKLPLIMTDGKFFLQEPYKIKEASNGNGNVFKAIKKSGIIDELVEKNINWISFGGIDNVLLKNCDPLFLGLAIQKNYEVASKSIFKKDPMENTAVYCKKYGKPSILDYCDITLELSEAKDENGFYLYREANILSHLMTLDAVKKSAEINLPYHRAFKKNAFVNEEGMKQVPDSPNSFKYENFIFDVFSYFDDMLLLRVNEDEEFAPIKDFTGIYNPDTAKEKYEKYWNNKQP